MSRTAVTDAGSAIGLAEFEAGRIEPGEFRHGDHVRIAWLYLRRYSLPVSLGRYCAGLRRLTKKFGVEAKYHETITWFFLLQVAERLQDREPAVPRHENDAWDDFRARNRDLFSGWRALLGRYYSKARLESAEAKRQFLLPDRVI